MIRGPTSAWQWTCPFAGGPEWTPLEPGLLTGDQSDARRCGRTGRDAAARAAASGNLDSYASVLVDVAEVMVLVSRPDEAAAVAYTHAAELCALEGNVVAERAMHGAPRDTTG